MERVFQNRNRSIPKPIIKRKPNILLFHWSKTISTVDQLYQEIKKGLQHLVEKYGGKSIFIGPDGAQTTSQYFKFPGLLTVTDLASAEEAIELIVSQGEGAQGDVEESHFRIFSGIKEEFHQLKALRPKFEAARPVLANPYAREAHDISNFNLLDNPVAIQFSNLFNAAYEVMTRILIRFFAYAEENKTELTLLIKTSIDMMKMVIRPLGELITKIPAGPSFPDNTAGPNFQFYRSIHLLPHKRAAWLIFHERLLEIADYCNKLATPGQFKERIEEIEKNLREMAGTSRTKFKILSEKFIKHRWLVYTFKSFPGSGQPVRQTVNQPMIG